MRSKTHQRLNVVNFQVDLQIKIEKKILNGLLELQMVMALFTLVELKKEFEVLHLK